MSKDRTNLLDNSFRKTLLGDDDVFHTIQFIEDVPILLKVEIGRVVMNMQEVLNLKKGNIIPFTKIIGEPMDILVEDRLMARGEVVVVNERYGVRISEVTRPEEKVGGRRE